MIHEHMTHRIPNNVILCNLGSPGNNTVYFGDITHTFNSYPQEFFYDITNAKSLHKLFDYTSIMSKPDNFIISDSIQRRNRMSETRWLYDCLKKAQWYFPHQLYYDIILEADDTEINNISILELDKGNRKNN